MAEDTERTRVQTYVPQYQRDIWREEAEEMGMSQAEFVRTMVQAGRDRFNLSPIDDDSTEEGREMDSQYTLESRVLEALSAHGPLDWEDLVDVLTEDIEEDLESALKDLQADNTVMYNGRDGGYNLREDDNVQ